MSVLVAGVVGAATASGSIRAEARTIGVVAAVPAAGVLGGALFGVVPLVESNCWTVSSGPMAAPPQAATSSQLSPNVISTRVSLLMSSLPCAGCTTFRKRGPSNQSRRTPSRLADTRTARAVIHVKNASHHHSRLLGAPLHEARLSRYVHYQITTR
jgi:hypothetical protein